MTNIHIVRAKYPKSCSSLNLTKLASGHHIEFVIKTTFISTDHNIIPWHYSFWVKTQLIRKPQKSSKGASKNESYLCPLNVNFSYQRANTFLTTFLTEANWCTFIQWHISWKGVEIESWALSSRFFLLRIYLTSYQQCKSMKLNLTTYVQVDSSVLPFAFNLDSRPKNFNLDTTKSAVFFFICSISISS